MTALIIEDEDIIAEVLKTKIMEIAPDVHVAEVLPSLKAARKWFGSQPQPDILFMDIQLSDGISFELLETHTFTCPIIFTTAYDEYAIRAFKVNSVDYLLKPVDEEELKRAIEKAKEIIQLKQPFQADLEALLKVLAQPHKNIPKYKEKFIVNIRNQWKPVDVKEIACFVKEVLNYVCLFNGEKYPLNYTPLDEIEELLDPKMYFRANRQFIIHIDAIQSVKSLEYSKLLVKLKEPNHKFAIEMSRDKAPLFKKWVDR